MTALFLGLLLPHYSYWWDEANTIHLVRGSFESLIADLRSTDGSEAAQPLYYLGLWFWAATLGTSEVAIRSLSLVFVLACVPVLELTFRAAGLSPHRAMSASVPFAILPVVVWYSLEARPYGLVLFLCVLHLFVSLRAIRAPSQGRAVSLGALTSLVAFSYSVAGCAALLSLGVVLCVSRRMLPRWGLTASLLLALPSLVFVVSSALSAEGANVPEGRSVLESVAYAGYELVLGRSMSFPVSVLRTSGLGELITYPKDMGVAVVGLLATLAILGITIRRVGTLPQEVLMVALSWLVGAGAFVALVAATGFPLLGRHLLFALPATYLIGAMVIAEHPRRSVRWSCLAFVLAFGAISAGNIRWDNRYEKDDFRAVASMLRVCEVSPNSLILSAPAVGLEFYAPEYAVDQVLLTKAERRFIDGDGVLLANTTHFDLGGARTARLALDHGGTLISYSGLDLLFPEDWSVPCLERGITARSD